MRTLAAIGRRRRLGAIGLAGLAAIALAGATGAQPAHAAVQGRIAYGSNQGPEGGGVFAIDPVSAETSMLTTTGDAYGEPSWSPDGARLAFVKYVDDDGDGQAENSEIFTMDADGSHVTQLTQ